MNKYFLLATALSSVVIFSGCNNDGGKSGPVKTQADLLKEASSASDYSTQIPMSSFTVIKRDLTYDEQKERYDVGCVTPGQQYGKSIEEMDNRFAAGQIFIEHGAFSSVKAKPYAAKTEKNILKVEPRSYNFEENYLEMAPFGPFQTINDIFTQKPHMTNKENFTLKDGSLRSDREMLSSNLTQTAVNYIASNPGGVYGNTFVSCSYDYKNDGDKLKSTSRIDKVSYMLNNKTVTAYVQTSTTLTPNIICKQYTVKEAGGGTIHLDDLKPDFVADMGPGYSEMITVSSNEVVNEGFFKCGGSELYFSYKVGLDSGKVLSSSVKKILAAPLR